MKIINSGYNNIVIGQNAEIDLTNEKLKLVLRTPNFDVTESLSEREYSLIRKTIDALIDLGYFDRELITKG